MLGILALLSFLITCYTVLCFITIIMSWIPGAKFTSFGRFLGTITGPYLNFFSRISFLRLGSVDFSPIISLGLLTIVSSVLSGIQQTGRIYLGGILATVIVTVFSAFSALTGIFFVLVFIRWIALAAKGGYTSPDSGWNQIDLLIKTAAYKVAGTIYKSNLSYQKALLISWIMALSATVVIKILSGILCTLCLQIPV